MGTLVEGVGVREGRDLVVADEQQGAGGRQVGDGGLRFRTMYFSTVDLAMVIPIFSSSPTILGDPQCGFAFDIRRISCLISADVDGRPGFVLPLSRAQ